MVWVRSNYQVWPSGISGMDNQPDDLVSDFYTLLNRLDVHMYKLSE